LSSPNGEDVFFSQEEFSTACECSSNLYLFNREKKKLQKLINERLQSQDVVSKGNFSRFITQFQPVKAPSRTIPGLENRQKLSVFTLTLTPAKTSKCVLFALFLRDSKYLTSHTTVLLNSCVTSHVLQPHTTILFILRDVLGFTTHFVLLNFCVIVHVLQLTVLQNFCFISHVLQPHTTVCKIFALFLMFYILPHTTVFAQFGVISHVSQPDTIVCSISA
jgi:hypothetical protein